jgi:glutathione S-transferase
MLKLWGRANSINVQKALYCIEELGLAYERIDAGRGYGVVDTAEYKAMNPNSLVPTLQDGDFILWESNVIVRYLCARHPDGDLWPRHLHVRAAADRWMDWQQTAITPAIGTAFHGLVRTPGSRPPQDIDKSAAKTDALFLILDAHLAGRMWLEGERFSMAECVMAPAVHRWLNMPVQHSDIPHVRRWYEAIMSRPAAERVLTLPIT